MRFNPREVMNSVLLALGEGGPDESSYIAMGVVVALAIVIYVISRGFSAATKGRGNPMAQTAVRSAPVQASRVDIIKSPRSSSTAGSRGEGTIYLLSHEELSAAKIGITGSSSRADRIQSHRERGWTLHATWVLPVFGDAETVEGAVLAWWRNELGLPPSCSASSMPQGGHTETVSLRSLSIEDIKAKVKTVIATTSKEALNPNSIAELIPGTYARISGTLKSASGVQAPRKKTRWQRWLIQDTSGYLVVEVSGRNMVRKEFLYPGRSIEVEGRVELMENTLELGKERTLLRMTNPKYVLQPFDARIGRSSGTIEGPKPLTQEQKNEIWRAKQRRRYRR